MYGEFLKEQREQLGISIYRLSKMSGVPEPTITSWERYGVEPTVTKYNKVLKALGVSLKLGKDRKYGKRSREANKDS